MKKNKLIRDYSKILDVKRPVSKTHPRMNLIDRASIFSPFAALTGLESALNYMQSSRCNKAVLTEDELISVHTKLSEIKKHDMILISYFMHDYGPDGNGGYADGYYTEKSGEVTSITLSTQSLCITVNDSLNTDIDKSLQKTSNQFTISFEDILSIKILK